MNGSIGGPFLQMAVFCERVLHEKDDVLSAIRIIDRFTHTVSSAEVIMPPLKLEFSMLISFKSGDAKGKSELKIRPNAPSGKELPGFSGPILFEGGERGANIIIKLGFEAKEEGVYWFDVILDEKLITRMSLQVVYQKMQITSTTAPPGH